MVINKIPSRGVYFLSGTELRNYPRLEFINPDKTMLTDEQVNTILNTTGWSMNIHFRTFASIDDARAACAEFGITDVRFVR